MNNLFKDWFSEKYIEKVSHKKLTIGMILVWIIGLLTGLLF